MTEISALLPVYNTNPDHLKECIERKYRKHAFNTSNNKKEMIIETEMLQTRLIEFLTSDKNEQKILLKDFTIPDVNILKKIFSITNVNNLKILRILGTKICWRRYNL